MEFTKGYKSSPTKIGISPTKKTKKPESTKVDKPLYQPLPQLTKKSLDPVRDKLQQYIQSLPGEKKIEHKYVMKVKGKCLNSFLGIIKSDISRLAVEGFPQELNKQMSALMLLKKYDLIWFDIQIEQRVATVKANFFVGYNLGFNYYKMGFLCLIGIAHLPESMNKLRFYRGFDIRPSLSTNICNVVEEEMAGVPKHAGLVTKNLFTAIKMICSQVIDKIQICGNIEYEDDKILIDEEMKLHEQEELLKQIESNKEINKTVFLDDLIEGVEEENEDEYGDELNHTEVMLHRK